MFSTYHFFLSFFSCLPSPSSAYLHFAVAFEKLLLYIFSCGSPERAILPAQHAQFLMSELSSSPKFQDSRLFYFHPKAALETHLLLHPFTCCRSRMMLCFSNLRYLFNRKFSLVLHSHCKPLVHSGFLGLFFFFPRFNIGRLYVSNLTHFFWAL